MYKKRTFTFLKNNDEAKKGEIVMVIDKFRIANVDPINSHKIIDNFIIENLDI